LGRATLRTAEGAAFAAAVPSKTNVTTLSKEHNGSKS